MKPSLVTARTPVGPSNTTDNNTAGDVALRDALAIVIGAWVVLFLLYFTLRNHNA